MQALERSPVMQRFAPEPGGDDLSRHSFVQELMAAISKQHEATLQWYENGELLTRTHASVHEDVIELLGRLAAFHDGRAIPLSRGATWVIAAPPSYSWVLLALAAFYRGIRVIALPETLSPEEVAASLEDLPFDWAFGTEATMDQPAFAGRHLKFEQLRTLPNAGATMQSVTMSPAMSLVAFTSGTTAASKLKAFELHPQGTEFFARAFTAAFGLVPGDNWLITSSFSHIVHFEYVLSCLRLGLNIQLAKPLDLVLNARALQPSAVITVPAVYEQLLTSLETRICRNTLGRWRLRLARLLPERGLTNETCRALLRRAFPEVAALTGGRLKVMVIGAAPSTRSLKRRLMCLGLPLYEGYGMSEVGMISCNVPGASRFGSIGRAFAGIETRLTGDHVLQVKCAFRRTEAHINVPEEDSRRVFLTDGWIDTGDVVEARSDGYFSIVGRRKSMLVTNRGEKINPLHIEQMLEEGSAVLHAVLVGNDRPYLTAVIAAREHATPQAVDSVIKAANLRLSVSQRIQKFVLVPDPFTIENGLLTRTGKVRRDAVLELYRRAIDELYAASPA